MYRDPELKKEITYRRAQIQLLQSGRKDQRVGALVEIYQVMNDDAQQAPPANAKKFEALVQLQGPLIGACVDMLRYIKISRRLQQQQQQQQSSEVSDPITNSLCKVLAKICSTKEIVSEIKEGQLIGLLDQILQMLSRTDLDDIATDAVADEKNRMLKRTLLKMLTSFELNMLIDVLYQLQIKYNKLADADRSMQYKISSCMLKLVFALQEIFNRKDEATSVQKEKLVNIKHLLGTIHDFLLTLPQQKTLRPDIEDEQDDEGYNIAKLIVSTLADYRRSEIWGDYNVISQHPEEDKYVYDWIQVLLGHYSQIVDDAYVQKRMKNIFNNLNCGLNDGKNIQVSLSNQKMQYHKAIKQVDKLIQSFPNYDWQGDAHKNDQLLTIVKNDIEKLRAGEMQAMQKLQQFSKRVNQQKSELDYSGQECLTNVNMTKDYLQKRLDAMQAKLVMLQDSNNN